MGISGRDGRTATVSDASTEKEELASASQASSYLQSPEVQEQESASSSFTDKAESTCFLFQDKCSLKFLLKLKNEFLLL